MSGNARGDARREALRIVAAELLAERGFGGLTHRALAERARAPLGSVTYYFPSAEDLAQQALQEATGTWLAASREALEALPARLSSRAATTRALLAVVTGGIDRPEVLTTLYERYLQAGRHAELRGLVVAADEEVAGLVAQVLERARCSPRAARMVLATVDGALLSALAQGRPDPVESVVPTVSELVGLLRR